MHLVGYLYEDFLICFEDLIFKIFSSANFFVFGVCVCVCVCVMERDKGFH
jgi:hypothetical protein